MFCSREAERLDDVPGLNCTSHRSLKPKEEVMMACSFGLSDPWLVLLSPGTSPSLSALFLCRFVYGDSYYGGLGACATPWTNQMGYVTVIARVARDLWQHKPPLS